LQARIRGLRAKREYEKRKQFYKQHLDAIVKIQSKWRARHMEKAYKSIGKMNGMA
jgi:hypothetical protein